jgi:beta-xylosidase
LHPSRVAVSAITYVNPVYAESFADPFVWRAAGAYYAIGTGAAEAAGTVGARVFPVISSPDLVRWRSLGHALERPDAAFGDTFWAPEVAERDGRFFLYYSVGHGERDHHLRVAVSDRPEGPYRDCAALTTPDACPFAIDPHPFRDLDGRDYLFFARDFLDTSDGARAGTALVVQELETMTRLTAEPRTVMRAHWDWQRYLENRTMYGRVLDWHTLEGPCVLLRNGTYYCMYSGGCWQTARYGVDYATASHVLGPWTDASDADGPHVLRGVPERVIGPGHHSVVLGPDGRTMFVCYHAWDVAMTARRLCIDPLVFTTAGPRCDGPSSAPRTVG